MAALIKYTFDADGTTVNPVNDRIVFAWERENETAFFRKVLKTKLLFRGADFAYFKGLFDADVCAFVVLTITRGSFEWAGKLRLSRGDWDLDKCEFEIEADAADDYACFLGQTKRSFNLLNYGTRIDVQPLYGTIETVTCNYSGTAPVFSGLVYYGACWPVPDQDFYPSTTPHGTQRWRPISTEKVFTSATDCSIDTTWAREAVTQVGTPPGGGWFNIGGNDWVRAINYATFSQRTVDNAYSSQDFYSEATYLDETLENGRRFADVLDEIVASLDCDVDGVRSNFLDTNPDGVSPTNDAYTQAADKLANLMMFQKSDIVTPTATGKAYIMFVTLEDCLKILRETFNVFWSIEVDGANKYLRLEQLSWYEQTTNGTDWTATAPAYIAGTRRWTEAEQVPQFEKFAFVQSFALNFGEKIIEYGEGCATVGQTIEHIPAQTVTDIGGIWQNPESGLEGVCLVATYEDSGTLYVSSANNDLNGDLSFVELVKWYWMHGRYSTDLSFTGGAVTVESTRRRKKQVEIKVPLCFDETFDPAQLQRTGLGWGEVDAAQWDTLTELLTLNLKQ